MVLVTCNYLGGQNTLSKIGFGSTFQPGKLSCIETETNEQISEIVRKYRLGLFRPVENNVLNAGISKKVFWIHFSVSNKAYENRPLVINVDNSRLNEIKLYSFGKDTIHYMGKQGDFYPFAKRSFFYKNFLFSDTLLSNQTKEYFLTVNQVGHAFILPIRILTPLHFQSEAFKDYFFDGITYGILLFVALFSLCFFLSSAHYLYLYYSLYIISAIAWFLSYFGLGFQYIWGNYPSLNTAMSPAMACINILLNLQICQILLKLIKTNGKLNTLMNFQKWVLAVLALFPLLINLNNYGYALNHLYLLCFLVSILLAMTAVSYAVISHAVKGNVAARVYLIASLLKAGSIINLALLELGIVPALPNMEGLLQIGIFVEISLLTYALALRYSSFRSKTFAKVIEAHENERAVISKEIHDGISNSLTAITYGIKDFTLNGSNLPGKKMLYLEHLLDELKNVQTEARNISHNTMPEYITKGNISEIVEKYICEIQRKVEGDGKRKNYVLLSFSANAQKSPFSIPVKLNIFRIIQEIVTNILKHSGATKADILFSFNKNEMIIIAEDNGVGLILHHNNKDSTGMGIKNLQTRVELLDGSLSIKSPVYKKDNEKVSASNGHLVPEEFGTLIKIKIPYRNNLLNNTTAYEY